MLARRRCIHFGLMVVVLTGISVGGSHVYGQGSFLEKLEAAVRDRLAESGQANQPSNNSSAAGKSAAGNPAAEELPSPSATGAATSNRPDTPKSVLEGNITSSLPASRPVPPPMADGGQAGNAPPAAGRIYLGLEAEELTGGGIGVRVTKISDGSPAWKAGFRPGDRIAGINGFAIANLDAMVEQLGKTAPGETVKFLINRNDRNMELVAVLMDAELASRIAGGPLATGAQASPNTGLPNDLIADDGPLGSAPWLGVVVNDLSPEFRKQFGLTVFRGAAVTSVAADSPASKIGMLAGDAIIAVAATPIETARDLTVWMSSARPGQTVEMTYQRGTASRIAPLTLEVTPEFRANRAANRAALPEPAKPRPNRSAAAPGEPKVSDVVPNAIPSPVVPSAGPATPPESMPLEVAELRREVARLQAELEKANQRLESTQNRLQKIIEGLGKE